MSCGRSQNWQSDEWRAGFQGLCIVIGGRKEGDEPGHFVWRGLGGEDFAAPLNERSGVDSSECQPALDIGKGNGKILRMRRHVLGDSLPVDAAVFPAEMVIFSGHEFFQNDEAARRMPD